MYQKLLVAYDGSFMSREAIENAKFYAKQNGYVQVHIVSILETTAPATNMSLRKSMMNELKERLQPQLDEIAKEFKMENVHVTTQLIAEDSPMNPGKTIVQYATENDIEVILIGSRGLGNIKSMLLGSVSNHVVHHADCHVFVIKGK